MTFEQISQLSSLAISLGILFYLCFRNNLVGYRIAAVFLIAGLTFKALEFQYEHSVVDVLLIALASLSLYMIGYLVGRENGRQKMISELEKKAGENNEEDK